MVNNKSNTGVFHITYGKRGVSEVIATIFMILIAILGVGAVAYFLIPWVSDSIKPDFSNLGLQIGLEYTFYNPVNETLYVQVERNINSLSDSNLSAMEIYVYWKGDVRTGKRSSVPGLGGSIIYAFNGLPNKPTSVKIAPVVNINGKLKLGKIVDELSDIRESNSIASILDGQINFGDSDKFPIEPAPLPSGELNNG